MALTDAERLQMTALALMRHSVIRYDSGNDGTIIGVPISKSSLDGIFIDTVVGTPTKIA